MDNENPVFRSLEIIESRISDKLTVENIASSVYFSKYHYGRLFREIMGDSVMEYVTKRKLSLAGEALLETNATILDIALRFGYDSHEGFTRSFKAYMGITPTEYRKYSLAAISQKAVKEKHTMLYSKTTDEIIRELNAFIATAKELAQSARKSEVPSYKPFWNSVADDTDSIADRVKAALDRISYITENPDEIVNRFAILKVIEDIAFESNVMVLQVGLTAIGRAKPEDIAIHKPLCQKYLELARMSSMKAGKVATFLSELTSLIIEDMRKSAEQKIRDSVQRGKESADSITGYAIYIKDELLYLVSELDSVPIELITVTTLEECLFKLKILIQAAKVDIFRKPDSKAMFDGMRVFYDSLVETVDFCRTIIKPEDNPPMERNVNKHFIDIAYQGNILRFYTKGEIEKLGGALIGERKDSFSKIDGKIDAYIKSSLSATNESAYKDIADKIYEVASDLSAEAEKLHEHGGAIKMLADEFKGLADAVMKCVK